MTEASFERAALREAEHRLPEMMAELEQLVSLESATEDGEGVAAMREALLEALEARGLRTVVHESGGRKHVEGALGDGPGYVLILSHMDTVWSRGTLRTRPFRREGEFAYGPGVADMKGGIVVALHALDLLRRLERVPAIGVRFLITSDEEVGSPTSRALIEELAGESCAVLVTEPGDLPDGKVKTSRKGTGIFSVRIEGRQAHAGAHHQDGASAISELARKVLEIDDWTDYERGTTLNVGVISGGSVRNVVAGEAEAQVDLRVTTPDEADRLEDLFHGLAPIDPRTKVTVRGEINRPPMPRIEGTARLYERASACAERLGFALPEVASGGASDGNFTAALGVPTLDGLGAVGAGIHAVDERISVSWLPRRAALMAALLSALDE